MVLFFFNESAVVFCSVRRKMGRKVVTGFQILASLVCLAQAGIGDRYTRRHAEVPDAGKEGAISISDPCYNFLNTANNQFFSPGIPGVTYTNNTDCVMVLEAKENQQIKLDFRDWFQIESSPGCKNDFLEVRDGPYGYSEPLIGAYCGIDVFPPIIMSSNRHLWIHFKSDENIEYKGFKAVFEYVNRTSTDVPEFAPCVLNISNQEEGVLARSNISNATIDQYWKYNLSLDCLFEITVRENLRIYLQFSDFHLDKPNECEKNFVQVFSDKTEMGKMEKQFCGSIADTVHSSGNKMFVRFFTVPSNRTRFEANFTAYRDIGSGKQQSCQKDEFYCEDANCIHKDLRCNKRYNCRFKWDEDGCEGVEAQTWSGDNIVIIMVIFSLILTGMCITFVYNCVSKLIRDHRTIQEYIRQSRDQQLNELDKQEQLDKKPSSKVGSRSRSHSSPSMASSRFDAINVVNTPCYVPGGDILPILVRNEHSMTPSNGDAYNTNIYTVDHENLPEMCDSACQTRESLFTTQGYSSGNSTPSHSVHTNSPPAPFSTFGYKKDKFKAEAKIEMTPQTHLGKYEEKRRPYSVQTTKSAPDVIVTH